MAFDLVGRECGVVGDGEYCGKSFWEGADDAPYRTGIPATPSRSEATEACGSSGPHGFASRPPGLRAGKHAVLLFGRVGEEGSRGIRLTQSAVSPGGFVLEGERRSFFELLDDELEPQAPGSRGLGQQCARTMHRPAVEAVNLWKSGNALDRRPRRA
jgi:hypothetical protein